ncbi:MAG: BadF/BadG/BcrA/BcrD ATPase family protein [Candidatus Hydrogenedentota bacterium]
MHYILGLDIGGTKIDCIIADEDGKICGFASAGTGSHEYHGIESAAREIEKAVCATLDDADISLGAVQSIGLGVAGADQPSDFPMLEDALYTPLFGDIPRVFVNDAFAALRGGTRASSGLVIACGTGAICAGISPSQERARAGGWMPEYGDRCTGETLGEEGLNSVWRAREDIVPPTLLTELFLERAGYSDVDTLFFDLYNQRLSTDALQPMAQLVFQAGQAGDAVACEILQRGGEYLGMMINAVARKLRMSDSAFAICTAGSVFSQGAPILHDSMAQIVKQVCRNAHFQRPIWIPVVGALLLGFEVENPISDKMYDKISKNLIQSESKYNKSFRVR